MEKTQAVGRLKKAGYRVQFDSSIVSVCLPMGANINQELKKLRAFFQEIGYDASFGIRQLRDVPVEYASDQEEVLEETGAAEVEHMAEVEIGEQFSLEDFGLQ